MIRRHSWMLLLVSGFALMPSPVRAAQPAPDPKLLRFFDSLAPQKASVAPATSAKEPGALTKSTCIAWTYCPDNGSVQCEGETCNSFEHAMCNVMCDGYHYFCPGHFGEELC